MSKTFVVFSWFQTTSIQALLHQAALLPLAEGDAIVSDVSAAEFILSSFHAGSPLSAETPIDGQRGALGDVRAFCQCSNLGRIKNRQQLREEFGR